MSILNQAVSKVLLERSQKPTLLLKLASNLELVDNNIAYSQLAAKLSIKDINSLFNGADKKLFEKSAQQCSQSNTTINISFGPFSYSENVFYLQLELVPRNISAGYYLLV